jgi:hypothetical protein
MSALHEVNSINVFRSVRVYRFLSSPKNSRMINEVWYYELVLIFMGEISFLFESTLEFLFRAKLWFGARGSVIG